MSAFKHPKLKPKYLSVGMNATANLQTLNHPRFDWKAFRWEVLLWLLIVVAIPSIGFLLLRIASRINLP